jgi:hypothetical protein
MILPEWFTKPDTIFKLVLWLLSPLYVWLAKKVWKKIEGWHALSSERAARIRMVSLRKALDNPPTLLESVAYLVCALPFPTALAMMLGVLYFVPFRPPSVGLVPLDPYTAEVVASTFVTALCFVNYLLFGVLTLYGIAVAYRLRDGEAQYAENYKKGIQKQIDRLTSKFPELMSGK